MNLQFRPQTQGKQTVPAKAFPTQMREGKKEGEREREGEGEGEGWRLQRGQTL